MMNHPESNCTTNKTNEVLKDIVTKYLDGSMIPTKDTPPWINQIILFHSNESITTQLIDQVMRSGGTDHPDPYFG